MSEVRVGTSVLIIRDGKMLVGVRQGSHAAGLLAFPGGHLDFGETWENCALREIAEECGNDFKIELVRNELGSVDLFVTNDYMPQYGKHYITIFMLANWVSGEAENTEPHKCEGWQWLTFEELKNNQMAQWIPLKLIETCRIKIGL